MDAKPLFLALFLAPAAFAGQWDALERQMEKNDQMFRDMDTDARHAEVLQRLDRIEQYQRAHQAPQPAPTAPPAGGYYPELMRNQCLAFPQTPGCQ
jgi:hypothetical protein